MSYALRLGLKIPVVLGVAFLTIPMMAAMYGCVSFADWRMRRRHSR